MKRMEEITEELQSAYTEHDDAVRRGDNGERDRISLIISRLEDELDEIATLTNGYNNV